MATKKIDPKKLQLPAKKAVVKTALATAEQAEIAVDKIHGGENNKPAAPAVAKEKGKSIRYSIDIPEQMHKDLKMHCLKNEMDMKDYFLGHARKDLYGE